MNAPKPPILDGKDTIYLSLALGAFTTGYGYLMAVLPSIFHLILR